jgi:hypothetical protein
MRTTLALAVLATAASASVTADISPSTSSPAGAVSSYDGQFELTVVNASTAASKRDIEARQSTSCGQSGVLTCTLKGGILKDSQNRTGYIASNHQFQFDDPPQDGAIYTAGWSVVQNTELALGSQTVFYQCLSGSFSNLYDESVATYCEPIYLDIIPCASSTGATTIRPISQISDGQPQGQTAVPPISQISDGQIQATGSAKPASKPPVSQISDGQIQATGTATANPAPPVSQISDGQIQATGSATTNPAAPVSQISDGQIQATGSAKAAATTLKPTANATTTSTSTTAAFTGAGNVFAVASSLTIGIVGLAAFLVL